jgi:hypothetical protein
MFRLTRYATGALPETRGDLHPSFCQDRSPFLEARSFRAKAEASLSRDRPCPKCDAPAIAGGTADHGMGGPLRHLAFLQGDDASALRQNAAAEFLGSRLTALANLTPYCNPHVNLYFHWDFPKFNISCVKMGGLPQYLADSREGRCICKGRSAAITVGCSAGDIRTLATKCCYEVTGGEHRVSARACPRMHRKFGKRLA